MTEQTLYLIRNKFTAEGWKTVKKTYDAQGKALSKVETQTKRYGKNYIKQTRTMAKGNIRLTETFGKVSQQSGGMVKALKRAAIVAPIWLAMRAAMMAVIQTVKEGAKYWMEFDKAMQKTEQVIHGVTGNMSEYVENLTTTIRKLSIETGQSMAKLSATFYRFGTVGLDFETSMNGMNAAVKLANVMFGDNEQIAKVLAQTYRLLGDSMDASIPVSKRMEVIGAQIYKLWKTNAFEIDEFTGALERFLPTANMFNFEISDSLALLASLHTAGVKGTRAGRLLGSSMQKLVSNMSEVAQTLGVNVNPALDTTFEMLMKTLGAVKKLNDAGRKIPDIENLTVFGGVRQRRAPMALVALYDTLLENIKSVNLENGKYSNLLSELDSKNQDILKSVHKQVEIFGNLRKQLGETFVKAIVGGEDFKESLKEINEMMATGIIPSFKLLGEIIHGTGWALEKLLRLFPLYGISMVINEQSYKKSIDQLRTMQAVFKALKGEFDKPTVMGVISTVKFKQKDLGLDDEQMKRLITDLERAAEKGKIFSSGIEKWEKIFAKDEAAANQFKQTIEGIQKAIKLGEVKEGVVGIPDPKTGKLLYVYADKLAGKAFENYKTQILIRGKIQEQLNLLSQQANYVELLNQGYLKSEVAMSKLTGYISEQVRIYNATQEVKEGAVRAIKTESILSAVLNKNYAKVLSIFNQTGIQQEKLLEMERKRLDIVKARIKEERKAPEISSETLKLYRIAQEYGVEPARRISEFLKGKIDYQQFQYRESFDIFKKEFAQMEEKFRAAEYFRRGEGRRIPIKEEALRLPDLVKKYKMKRPEEALKIPEVPVVSAKIDFKTIIEKIEVKLPEGTQGDLAESIGKDVIESLKRNEDLAKLLAKTIRPYI